MIIRNTKPINAIFPLLSLLIAFLSSSLYAQDFFVKNYGVPNPGNSNLERRIIASSDGGFLMHHNSIQLIRINDAGQLLWTKGMNANTFSQWMGQWSVAALPSGGFIVGGGAEGINSDMYMVRLDNNGDTLWTRRFSSDAIPPKEEFFTAITGTIDGAIVAAGFFGDCMALMQLNATGDILWTKFLNIANLGGSPTCLVQASNGDLIMGGFAANTNGTNDHFLMRLSSSGDIIWAKQFGGPESDQMKDVKIAADGSIITFGVYTFFANGNSQDNYLIAKFSANGDLLWQKNYNFLQSDQAKSLIVQSNGVVFSGLSGIFPVVFKTDFSGNILFSKAYNLQSSFSGGNLLAAGDGSLYFTNDYAGQAQKLFKTDSMGNGCSASSTIQLTDTTLPFSSQIVSPEFLTKNLLRKNLVPYLYIPSITPASICNTTAVQIPEEKETGSLIIPNPCRDCNLKTPRFSDKWVCHDLLGRNIPIELEPDGSAYRIVFKNEMKPQILLFRNTDSGEQLRFCKF